MKWFIEEITRLIDQLRRWQTWAVIAMIGVFAGLAKDARWQDYADRLLERPDQA